MLAGIAPCLPGFLAAAKPVDESAVAPVWKTIYGYAWFVSFVIAGATYYVLDRMLKRNSITAR